MAKNKQKYPYNRYSNETMCGDRSATGEAERDMELLRQDVEALKLAVSELKSALAALQGASKPSQSPTGSEVDPNLPAPGAGTVTDVDPNTGAPLSAPRGPLPEAPDNGSREGGQEGSDLPALPSTADRPSDSGDRACDGDQGARARRVK